MRQLQKFAFLLVAVFCGTSIAFAREVTIMTNPSTAKIYMDGNVFKTISNKSEIIQVAETKSEIIRLNGQK